MPGVPENPRSIELENSSMPIGAGRASKDFGPIADLAHNLNRLKVWLQVGKDSPQVASMLLDRERVQEAAEALSLQGTDSISHKQRALEALGIYEQAESKTQHTALDKVLGIGGRGSNPQEKKNFDALWELDFQGKKLNLEKWVDQLTSTKKADKALLTQLQERLTRIQNEFGVEELKGVTLNRETLGEIETRVAMLKARKDYLVGTKQKELRQDKTAVASAYGEAIQDKNGLLQVRGKDAKAVSLQPVVDRVRLHAERDATFTALGKLSEKDLIGRFEDVNALLANMSSLDAYRLNLNEAKKLRHLLTNLQIQYQEQLAGRISKYWKEKENKADEWGEIASKSVEKTLNKKRKALSEQIVLRGSSQQEKYDNLRVDAHKEGQKAVEELKSAQYRVKAPESSSRNSEPDEREWIKNKQWEALDTRLDAILGGTTYHIFEDKDFWKDLSKNGNVGIDAIVDRATKAGVRRKAEFRDILVRIRDGKDAMSGVGGERGRGGLEIVGKLHKFIDMGDYGAAANVMLEYTTRVGMQENSSDLEYMYVRREFMEAISHVSADFAEQFGKNQAMNYLPGLSSQKPEDYYNVQAKIFDKSNADMFFGDNAFMSGNLVTLENGKKVVFSTKTFLAALRSEKNQLRIMRTDPNTNDSTLQNIMLEEIYGQGAHLHLGKPPKRKNFIPPDPKNPEGRVLYLALPGQKESQYQLLSEVKVDMQFANLDVGGFNAQDPWNKHIHKTDLKEVLERNTWMLRNSAQFMWYSEIWMDTLKSYQPAIMDNTAKSLLVAASAIADYKASFELVSPPYLEVMQKIGDMLGPMERYKAEDMVQRNVAEVLTAAAEKGGLRRKMDEKSRHNEQVIDSKIGEIFKKIYVREGEATVNGVKQKLANRVRTREMTRLAFNDLSEFDTEVGELVRNRLINLGMYERDIPNVAELQKNYKTWKDMAAQGKIPEGKVGFMGQEYHAVWQEVDELKMDKPIEDFPVSGQTMSYQEFWNTHVDKGGRFKVLQEMNAKLTGIKRPGATKDTFFKNFEIEAFVDRTGTKHSDDWDQFAKKYAPAKIEALKIAYKIASGAGNAEDYTLFLDQISLFAKPDEKRALMLLLMERQHLMTSEQWVVPYEVASLRKDAHGHDPKGTGEIKWVSYKDSNGKEFFARTADGTRAFHKEMYRGNYARQVLGKDMWRPHDFEVILEVMRGRMLVSKHEAHNIAEKILGTRRTVEYFTNGLANRLGIPEEKMKKFVDVVSKGTSWVKLMALKIFLFDDPKYALWTFGLEVLGMTGKTFESIFGFSVGGGGGKGHH